MHYLVIASKKGNFVLKDVWRDRFALPRYVLEDQYIYVCVWRVLSARYSTYCNKRTQAHSTNFI